MQEDWLLLRWVTLRRTAETPRSRRMSSATSASLRSNWCFCPGPPWHLGTAY